jgi:hypothetical protein
MNTVNLPILSFFYFLSLNFLFIPFLSCIAYLPLCPIFLIAFIRVYTVHTCPKLLTLICIKYEYNVDLGSKSVLSKIHTILQVGTTSIAWKLSFIYG